MPDWTKQRQLTEMLYYLLEVRDPCSPAVTGVIIEGQVLPLHKWELQWAEQSYDPYSPVKTGR